MAVMDLANAVEPVDFEDRNRESLQLCVQRRGSSSSPERYQFADGFAVIGSAETCQLRLDDPTVAAKALYVQQLADRVVFVSLDGVTVDRPLGADDPVQRRTVNNLPTGVPVSVGPFQIWQSAVVPSDLEGLPRVGEKPLPSFSEPVATWEIANVKGDQSTRRSRHIRHALTLVGCGPMCRFRMVHDSISEIHASLVSVQGALQVVDLCSEHGVYVNGQRVSHAMLQDGDELRIGHCHGTIRWLGLPDQIPATQPMPVTPEPVELSPDHLAAEVPVDGIVVSLSDNGLDVQGTCTELIPDFSSNVPVYSEERCLTLVTQFLEMQQSVLEQTQLLMEKITERLQSAPPAVRFPPRQSDETESPVQVVEESDDGTAPAPVPRRNRHRPARQVEADATPAPEFHAWLTHQLAELESSQRSGFSRLWERLTGLK